LQNVAAFCHVGGLLEHVTCATWVAAMGVKKVPEVAGLQD